MDYSKLFLGLASVTAGWFLAQFTSFLKEWFKVRKIKRCLLEELDELKSEFERTLLIYARQLQIHALGGIDNGAATKLSNHIFNNYYKDAVLSLNKDQRISYQLIHTSVGSVNSGIEQLHTLTSGLQEKNTLEGSKSLRAEDFENWGKNVIAEFTNVASALWHVKYHLDNPKKPELSAYTKNHEVYLEYLENVECEVNKVMEEAKTLDREHFEKIYNPETFANKFL